MTEPVETPGGHVYDKEALLSFVRFTHMWPDTFLDTTTDSAQKELVLREDIQEWIDSLNTHLINY